MKQFILLAILAGSAAMAQSFELSAICEINPKKPSQYMRQYGRLYLSTDNATIQTFSTMTEAMDFEVSSSKYLEIYTPEPRFFNRLVYASPSLDEAVKTYNSVVLIKVEKDVFRKANAWRASNSSFSVKIERRDYDDDYSGIFYWFHGYVKKDSAEYFCRLL